MRNVRVMIADDSLDSRKGLHALLGTFPGIELVQQDACNGEEAVRLAQVNHPDVLIIDIKMPKLDGIHAIQRIKSTCPEMNVVALTLYTTYRREALQVGADCFLLKGCQAQDLYNAIMRPFGVQHLDDAGS